MRICFVTNSMDVGGVETNIVRLTAALTARGHDVVVAAAPGRLSNALAAAGGGHVKLRMRWSRPHLLALDAWRLHQFLRGQPTVVQVFSAPAAVVTQLAVMLGWLARPRRKPTVYAAIMGLHSSPTESDWWVRLRVLLTSVGAHRLFVMSPAINRYVQGLPIAQGRLVYQSVVGVEIPPVPGNQSGREAAKRELGLSAGRRIVTTIGRLEPRKSHELFVQAAGILLLARDDVDFLLVGDGELDQFLRDEVERIHGKDRVRLLGNRSDLELLVRATDVYVRPGVVEGFIGNTVMEAQALGVPVVSFDTEDVRLAIDDGRTGLLVPAGDVQGLARAMGRLLADDKLARSIGEAGRKHMEEVYSLPAVVSALEAIWTASPSVVNQAS